MTSFTDLLNLELYILVKLISLSLTCIRILVLLIYKQRDLTSG